jgi:hypothetical protein
VLSNGARANWTLASVRGHGGLERGERAHGARGRERGHARGVHQPLGHTRGIAGRRAAVGKPPAHAGGRAAKRQGHEVAAARATGSANAVHAAARGRAVSERTGGIPAWGSGARGQGRQSAVNVGAARDAAAPERGRPGRLGGR